MATLVTPSRQARPNVSDTMTAIRQPSRRVSTAHNRRADASGSSGSSVTQPGSTFDASTPAFAHTNPCRVSTIRMPWSIRTMRFASPRMTSTTLASFPVSSAHRVAIADGVTVSSRTMAPSALETTFCATTNTSPGSTARVPCSMAPAIIAPRSAPTVTSGSAGTANR